MKHRAIILLFWYFLAYDGGWYAGFLETVGPFQQKSQCETMKSKVASLFRVEWVSDCWRAE